MRILAQGSTAIGAAITQIIPPASFTAGRGSRYIWFGAGDTNAAAARIGLTGTGNSVPQHFLDTTDKKGFEIEHDAPNDLYATGTATDVIRWVIYG
jgi:hypothetical protein